MSPRSYNLGRRAATADETRRRIIEATSELHVERGIRATTYKDIAARADVGIGTVYHHFPDVNQLYAACGALVYERARIPGQEVFEGATGPLRVERLVAELFGYYSRHTSYERARCDADKIAVIAASLERRDGAVESLVRAALPRTDRATIHVVTALAGYDVWKSLTTRGRMSTKQAAHRVATAINAWLETL